MKASLALCLLAPALLIIPAKAARLALPPVPHYELPTPQLPKPATPPRYTEDYQEREPSRRRGDDESKNHKCFWECVVAVWRGIINDPVAFVTLSLVAVACVQAALFVWQLILIGKNLQDAKKAAEAAGESAKGTLETVRVLRNAQRPYLSPFEPTLGNYDQAIRNDDASLVRIDVQLDITNVGPGVGFIRSCCITDEICVRDSQGSKPLRVNDYIGRFPLHQHGKWTLEGDATFHAFRISNAERDAILRRNNVLYIWGHVRYFDLFHINRRTGFIFECIPETGVLVMCPHALWYDVEE